MAYIGPAPNPGQNREVDDISSGFNGGTASFTLQVNGQNVSPGSANAIVVSLGGVIQNPGTDYTIAASTITFTTNPASGLSFFGLVLGQGIDTQSIADGSITAAKFASGAIQTTSGTDNFTVADGDLVIGTAGHGIDFSANSHASGMTSELLDSYEEGTFTPNYNTTSDDLTLNGLSRTTASLYQSRKGVYTKIGRRVWFQISLATTGITSVGGSGNIAVDGLPFTAVAESTTQTRYVMACQGGRFNSFTPLFLVVNPGTTLCQVRQDFDTQKNTSGFDTSNSSNRNVIECFGSYEVAS